MTGTSNARIRTMDMPILEEVFVMGDGFVFNFSNRTFADFFREELQVDIDHPRWEAQGGSKAKRLRYYLRQADRRTALDTLNRAVGIPRDKRRHPRLPQAGRYGTRRVLQDPRTPRGTAAIASSNLPHTVTTVDRSRCRVISCRPFAPGFQTGTPAPRLCVREIPERHVQCV